MTSDERWLLIACGDGSLSLWEIESGTRVWEQTPKQTGLGYIYDASFAADGETCVVCDSHGQAVTIKTMTGEHLGKVQSSAMSAALAPDGLSGVFVGLDQKLYTFDLASGTHRDTGMTGGWPVRYSVDGKFIALRSNNSGTEEHVRIVQMEGNLTKQDVGTFSRIGHIRPAADGTFLVCGVTDDGPDKLTAVVGVRVRPSTRMTEVIWRTHNHNGVEIKTDFRTDSKRGVSTDFRFVTKVVDLETGDVLLEIDNSANYDQIPVSYTSSTLFWGAVVGVIVAALIVAARLKGRRNTAEPKGSTNAEEQR